MSFQWGAASPQVSAPNALYGTPGATTNVGFGGSPQGQVGLGVGGFGSPPRTHGFGSTGGFGSAGGFGSTSGGFGGTTRGFGSSGGFGFGTTGGFGSTTAGGFGSSGFNTMGGANFLPPSSATQSVVGRYLLQWDSSYNAAHPDCKFRSFVYNMCPPGQSEQAMLSERSRTGIGVREDQWIAARKENPDADLMYPCPVHFMVGLKQRALKQQEALKDLSKRVELADSRTEELRTLLERNNTRFKKIATQQANLQQKILSIYSRTEALRQHGLQLGSEKYNVLEKTAQLSNELHTPGRYGGALATLQPLLDARKSRSAALGRMSKSNAELTLASRHDVIGGGHGGGGATSTTMRRWGDATAEGTNITAARGAPIAQVDLHVIRDWTRFLERLSTGLEDIAKTLAKDAADVDAAMAKQHGGGSGGDHHHC